ncbi:MAG: NAD(P)-binding domain-containing protein, partial [Bradyrhizobium sp.]
MQANDGMKTGRRGFLQAAAAGLALGALPQAVRTAASAEPGLKIGVIGSGRIGSTLGGIWVKAGHEVMFSSLDLEHDKALAARLGG